MINPMEDAAAALASLLPSRDFPAILDALPIPLSWASLHDGRILFMNRRFKRVFDCDQTQYPTVDAWIEGAYPREEDRIASRKLWAGLWEPEGAGLLEIGPCELQVRRGDGLLLTVQHRGILLHEQGIGIAIFEDVSDRAESAEALRRLADQDALTGLANRRALQARWAADVDGQREHASAALLMADLDGFKTVNDAYGHDVGDEVLRVVARRLLSCVRGDDVVCRVGGDEFAILLPVISDAAAVAVVCRRLRAAVQQTVDVEGQRVNLDLSVGISLYPQDGDSLQSLMRCADQTLYRVKRRGVGGWAWYRPPGVGPADEDL